MLRGGVADKLGNDYEAHWTLIEALGVLRGHAEEIRLEAFNEDATGFESGYDFRPECLAPMQAPPRQRLLDNAGSCD
jgi:hypothetical protein